MTESTHLAPVTLEGRLVRLEPMSLDHLDGLAEVAFDESLWRWTIGRPLDRDALRDWMDRAIANREAGTELPFVTVERTSGRPIGSSRYLSLALEHRRLEIGWTWLAPSFQRTALNTEAKYLMLKHGFEELGAIRIELKTDSLNERSRRAILRMGAKEEGTLRNHMITWTGRFRHSVLFSVIESEWPSVKAGLEQKLEQSPPAR